MQGWKGFDNDYFMREMSFRSPASRFENCPVVSTLPKLVFINFQVMEKILLRYIVSPCFFISRPKFYYLIATLRICNGFGPDGNAYNPVGWSFEAAKKRGNKQLNNQLLPCKIRFSLPGSPFESCPAVSSLPLVDDVTKWDRKQMRFSVCRKPGFWARFPTNDVFRSRANIQRAKTI